MRFIGLGSTAAVSLSAVVKFIIGSAVLAYGEFTTTPTFVPSEIPEFMVPIVEMMEKCESETILPGFMSFKHRNLLSIWS